MPRGNLGTETFPTYQNFRNAFGFTDRTAESPASTLVRLFRTQALRRVEYSFGATPDAYGTMVAGRGDDFAGRVRQFAERLAFAQSWAPFAESFGSLCGANLLYFKIDQEDHLFSKLTIYGRYFEPIGHEALRRLETDVLPIQWQGPSPILLASLFETKGPQGVGFEVDRNGCQNLSYYFEIESNSASFSQRILPLAFTSWEWPGEPLAQAIHDVETLFPSHCTGWLALEVNEENLMTMKLDAFRIPVRKAIEFLQTKGLAAASEGTLLHLCQRLRCDTFNYVGIAYDKTGFKGWKVYIAVSTADHRQPTKPKIM